MTGKARGHEKVVQARSLIQNGKPVRRVMAKPGKAADDVDMPQKGKKCGYPFGDLDEGLKVHPLAEVVGRHLGGFAGNMEVAL